MHDGGPLFLCESTRRIEERCLQRLPAGTLMRRAAAAVADETDRLARDLPQGVPILVLAGPGNNGADGLLAGMMLAERGYRVAACGPAARSADADGLAVRAAWRARLGELAALSESARMLSEGPIVIDALFGIGLDRALGGELTRMVSEANARARAIVAVDVPSGIDADRGVVVGGADGVAIRAHRTVTMLADKPGLHTGAALDHVGECRVNRLGVETLESATVAPDGHLLDAEFARARMPIRRRDSHKGSHGSVAILGGAQGTRGAALLAAAGAQAGGAGKVFVSSPNGALFDPAHADWMTLPWSVDPGAFEEFDALICGCGLGRSGLAREGMVAALGSSRPLLLDADALNLLAGDSDLAGRLGARDAPTVITPHPLEAARLLGCTVGDVQSDRMAQACNLARRFDCVVVLKGAGSVIASPKRWAIVGAGAPTLATAGTGDVLAGLIGALLVQVLGIFDAAATGAWLHARAGEQAMADYPTGIGLSAVDLPRYLSRVFRQG